MPIRHCQKCGLKVLIDESQSAANPFYCQRCTASMKSEPREVAGDTPATAPRREAAAPAPAPAPVRAEAAPPPAPKAAAGSVRVHCPYCKASFNGRVPQKPARGACPVCQKDLILLPGGDIRPAAGFDVAKWQSENDPMRFAAPAAKAKEETKSKARKLASPEETEVPETEPAPAPGGDGGEGALPSWLDDENARPKAAKARPAPPPPPVEEPAPAPMDLEGAAEPVPAPVYPSLDDAPAAPIEAPAPEPPPPPPPAAIDPVEEAIANALTPEPQPAVSKAAAAAAARGTGRRSAMAGAAPSPAPTGSGKVFLAFILFILPVVACPIMLGVREKLAGPLGALGARFAKGFLALHEKLSEPAAKPAPPPPPPPAPPPSEEKPKPTEEDRKRDKDEITKLWLDYMREKRTVDQKATGATDAEKDMIEKARADLKQKLEAITSRRELHKKTYGEDFDPTKE